jgi:hypothetical protein
LFNEIDQGFFYLQGVFGFIIIDPREEEGARAFIPEGEVLRIWETSKASEGDGFKGRQIPSSGSTPKETVHSCGPSIFVP